MEIIQIIEKCNKIIFKISFLNNFTNLNFYYFFVLSSDFGYIQGKMITFLKIFNFIKALNFSFFGNIFVHNRLKNFVLGPLNAVFCHLPFYPKGKINCYVFYKLKTFM